MNHSKRSRLTLIVSVMIVAATLLFCCGIPLGLIDRYLLLHIYSYEQTSPVSIEDVPIIVQVRPKKRIQVPPERLVGPPYGLFIWLTDTTHSAVEAKLHAFDIRLDDGQLIAGYIPVGARKWKEGLDSTFLYVKFKANELGRQPTAIADIEIIYPDRYVRRTLKIPLRADHRRTLYIP